MLDASLVRLAVTALLETIDAAALARLAAAAAMATEKVSLALAPPASVALTDRLSVEAVAGAAPEKVRVAALKLSQLGKAEPLDVAA